MIRRLQKDDYRVLAPANPLRSLDGDSAYLSRVLAQEQGPFVLVGHSYSGAVITNAAAGNTNVNALVYINGFVPDIGELGPTDFDVYIKTANFHETFAGDLSNKARSGSWPNVRDRRPSRSTRPTSRSCPSRARWST